MKTSPFEKDRALSELLQRFVEDFRSTGVPSGLSADAPPGDNLVLTSAADLFVYYKKCMVQCTTLSKGEPLLYLTSVFKKYLTGELMKRVVTDFSVTP